MYNLHCTAKQDLISPCLEYHGPYMHQDMSHMVMGSAILDRSHPTHVLMWHSENQLAPSLTTKREGFSNIFGMVAI